MAQLNGTHWLERVCQVSEASLVLHIVRSIVHEMDYQSQETISATGFL